LGGTTRTRVPPISNRRSLAVVQTKGYHPQRPQHPLPQFRQDLHLPMSHLQTRSPVVLVIQNQPLLALPFKYSTYPSQNRMKGHSEVHSFLRPNVNVIADILTVLGIDVYLAEEDELHIMGLVSSYRIRFPSILFVATEMVHIFILHVTSHHSSNPTPPSLQRFPVVIFIQHPLYSCSFHFQRQRLSFVSTF